MGHPLRHISSQPHLRVLAWLAWLMLALLPAHAAPAAMLGNVSPMPPMPAAMQQHHPDRAAECGTGPLSMTQCHCAAGCAFTMPMAEASALLPMRFKARHGLHRVVQAPVLPPVPPLRPPLLPIAT